MILVDMSVWIDFFCGRDSREATQLVAALEADENICICGPILMEFAKALLPIEMLEISSGECRR